MRVVPTHTCFPHEAAKNISYADVTVKKCESFQHTPFLVIELQKVFHPVPGLVVKKYESFQCTPVFLKKLQKVFHPVPGLVVKKRELFQHTCFPQEAAKSISSCARTGGEKA